MLSKNDEIILVEEDLKRACIIYRGHGKKLISYKQKNSATVLLDMS